MLLARRTWLATFLAASAAPLLPGTRPVAAQSGQVHEHAMGDPAAPVTMVEYSSLTCPHCAAFHRDTLPALKQRYIDTGKVKLIVRDFPLDQLALKAAVVAHCAGDERYFTFLEALFASQGRWARASDPVAALQQLAVAGGLPRERVQACLADRGMEDAVLQMRLAGQNQFDIGSTPTFIINGTAYPGGRTVEEFATIIDPLLPKS
jgi:protein-disulfide isomerase